jgi:regulatory protein YycH of two-component signal transduction system YycFG
MRKKHESDIENITRQLKKTQNELTLSQQHEIQKLLADNSDLMREKTKWEIQCIEMHTQLTHLFEDAEIVRAQVNQEISEYRKSQA